jgi:PAS domain-containing protein
VGSWEWNILQDEVWWSRELYHIFGEPLSFEPSYLGFFDRVHPDDRAQVREQIEHTLHSDQPYRLSYRILRHNGSEGVIFTVARLERTPDGRPARLVGTCQDITEFDPSAKVPARRSRT